MCWGTSIRLWADKTTLKIATSQTPCSLVFGMDVVIPTEVVIPIARYQFQNQKSNDEILAQDLDTIDEL